MLGQSVTLEALFIEALEVDLVKVMVLDFLIEAFLGKRVKDCVQLVLQIQLQLLNFPLDEGLQVLLHSLLYTVSFES